MNDYTLPPPVFAYYWSDTDRCEDFSGFSFAEQPAGGQQCCVALVKMGDVESYGAAVAEHVRAPLLARIAELEEERDRVQKGLLDPDTVHVNMLRGTIAWIGWRRACHITGDVPNGEDYQLSEIVRLRAEVEALRECLRECADDPRA